MPNNSYFIYPCTSFIFTHCLHVCISYKNKGMLGIFLSSFPRMLTSSSFLVIWYITRNHGLLTKNSVKKTHVVFLPPCPIWRKCHFEQVDCDMFVLIKSFWLSFFIKFILLVKWDNHISAPILKFWNFQLKETQILFIYL